MLLVSRKNKKDDVRSFLLSFCFVPVTKVICLPAVFLVISWGQLTYCQAQSPIALDKARARINDKEGTPDELRATEKADPAEELKKSTARNQLRFLGAGGFGLSVPGVSGGVSNPLVMLVGVRQIEGTGDALSSTEEVRLQPIAYNYAQRYNRLLLKYLVQSNHSSVLLARCGADEEMNRLENSDAVADAKKMLQRQNHFPSLIEVLGQKERTPGVTAAKAWTMGNARGYAPLRLSREFLTAAQNKRLSLLLQTYVEPYNRYVYQHYKEYSSF